MRSDSLPIRWTLVGGICGFISVIAFIGASVIGGIFDQPTFVGRLLGFSFGPLLSLAFWGLYQMISRERQSVTLQMATFFGVVGGVIVNVMIVVQSALFMRVPTPERSAIGFAWEGLNAIQLGMDVSWDIFISTASIFLGIAMLSHARFGKFFGGMTTFIGLGLIVLNLATFPAPPDTAGLIDLGPVMGVWYLVISVRMLGSIGWMRAQSA